MITFYPRDIGMWRDDFDFSQDITLAPKEKPKSKTFHDRDELIQFLKEHRVRTDDIENPLIISKYNGKHPTLGLDVYEIVQWSLIGWIKDDYR